MTQNLHHLFSNSLFNSRFISTDSPLYDKLDLICKQSSSLPHISMLTRACVPAPSRAKCLGIRTAVRGKTVTVKRVPRRR